MRPFARPWSAFAACGAGATAADAPADAVRGAAAAEPPHARAGGAGAGQWVPALPEPLLAAGLPEARRGAEPGLAPSASGRKERLGLGASGPTRTLYYAHA